MNPTQSDFTPRLRTQLMSGLVNQPPSIPPPVRSSPAPSPFLLRDRMRMMEQYSLPAEQANTLGLELPPSYNPHALATVTVKPHQITTGPARSKALALAKSLHPVLTAPSHRALHHPPAVAFGSTRARDTKPLGNEPSLDTTASSRDAPTSLTSSASHRDHAPSEHVARMHTRASPPARAGTAGARIALLAGTSAGGVRLPYSRALASGHGARAPQAGDLHGAAAAAQANDPVAADAAATAHGAEAPPTSAPQGRLNPCTNPYSRLLGAAPATQPQPSTQSAMTAAPTLRAAPPATAATLPSLPPLHAPLPLPLALPHTQHVVHLTTTPTDAPALIPLSQHEVLLVKALTERQAALLATFRTRLGATLQKVDARLKVRGAGVRAHLQRITDRYRARLERVVQWLDAVEDARERVRVLRGEHAALRRALDNEREGLRDVLGEEEEEEGEEEATAALDADDSSVEGLVLMLEERIRHKDVACAAIVRELVRLDREIEVNTGRRGADVDGAGAVRAEAGAGDGDGQSESSSIVDGSLNTTASAPALTHSSSLQGSSVGVKREYNAAIVAARATLASLYAASLGEAEEDETRKRQLREECRASEAELEHLRSQLRRERAKALQCAESLSLAEQGRQHAITALKKAADMAISTVGGVISEAIARLAAGAAHCDAVFAASTNTKLQRICTVGSLCEGCLGPLVSPHVMWPCGHVLCRRCVDKGIERRPGTMTIVDQRGQLDGPVKRIACLECRADLHAAISAVDDGIDVHRDDDPQEIATAKRLGHVSVHGYNQRDLRDREGDVSQDLRRRRNSYSLLDLPDTHEQAAAITARSAPPPSTATPAVAAQAAPVIGSVSQTTPAADVAEAERELSAARVRALKVLKRLSMYQNPYIHPNPLFNGCHLPLPLDVTGDLGLAVRQVEQSLARVRDAHGRGFHELSEAAKRVGREVRDILNVGVGSDKSPQTGPRSVGGARGREGGYSVRFDVHTDAQVERRGATTRSADGHGGSVSPVRRAGSGVAEADGSSQRVPDSDTVAASVATALKGLASPAFGKPSLAGQSGFFPLKPSFKQDRPAPSGFSRGIDTAAEAPGHTPGAAPAADTAVGAGGAPWSPTRAGGVSMVPSVGADGRFIPASSFLQRYLAHTQPESAQANADGAAEAGDSGDGLAAGADVAIEVSSAGATDATAAVTDAGVSASIAADASSVDTAGRGTGDLGSDSADPHTTDALPSSVCSTATPLPRHFLSGLSVADTEAPSPSLFLDILTPPPTLSVTVLSPAPARPRALSPAAAALPRLSPRGHAHPSPRRNASAGARKSPSTSAATPHQPRPAPSPRAAQAIPTAGHPARQHSHVLRPSARVVGKTASVFTPVAVVTADASPEIEYATDAVTERAARTAASPESLVAADVPPSAVPPPRTALPPAQVPLLIAASIASAPVAGAPVMSAEEVSTLLDSVVPASAELRALLHEQTDTASAGADDDAVAGGVVAAVAALAKGARVEQARVEQSVDSTAATFAADATKVVASGGGADPASDVPAGVQTVAHDAGELTSVARVSSTLPPSAAAPADADAASPVPPTAPASTDSSNVAPSESPPVALPSTVEALAHTDSLLRQSEELTRELARPALAKRATVSKAQLLLPTLPRPSPRVQVNVSGEWSSSPSTSSPQPCASASRGAGSPQLGFGGLMFTDVSVPVLSSMSCTTASKSPRAANLAGFSPRAGGTNSGAAELSASSPRAFFLPIDMPSEGIQLPLATSSPDLKPRISPQPDDARGTRSRHQPLEVAREVYRTAVLSTESLRRGRELLDQEDTVVEVMNAYDEIDAEWKVVPADASV